MEYTIKETIICLCIIFFIPVMLVIIGISEQFKNKEHHYGVDHPKVAKTLTSLGDTYQYLGNLKRR